MQQADVLYGMNSARCREILGIAALLLVAGHFAPVFGINSTERWETEIMPSVSQNKEMMDAGIKGRSVPVGPTGIQAIITEENPACFTVKYVYKNSPAFGKVKVGDLICGANGTRLKTPHTFRSTQGGGKGMEGPLTEMAPLIEDSQGRDGKLDLMVNPGGNTKVTEKVTIQIKPVGRFSATYPYNCPRSDKLVDELCEIIERDLALPGNRTHVMHHMLLGLMASGEKKYESTIKARTNRDGSGDAGLIGPGFPSWNAGYEGVFLGEYYLKTKDRGVFPRIEVLNNYYLHGIAWENGGFSHRSRVVLIKTVAEGGPPGYGSMSAPGGLAMLAMSLFKAGGVPYAEFAYERIHRAFLQSSNEEGMRVGYGFDGQPMIHILVKDPKQGQSGKGVGFRCPTGMKGITDYTIKGVGLWCNSSPTNRLNSGKKPATAWMWDDTSWLEKERDSNIVEEWGGNQRCIIRNPVLPEPTKPYNTTKGNSQAGNGAGALAHLIGNSDRKSWEYLGKHAANSAALAPEKWFMGHCSGGMHQLWQTLAAARADKEKFRAFMDYNKWWFIMMQTHEGSYMTCPNRDKADQDAGYGPYNMPTANAAIILALPRRQLQITGADGTAGGYATSSSSSSTASSKSKPVAKPVAQPVATPVDVPVATPAVRKARKLLPKKLAILDAALLRALAALSETGQLTPVPLKMSFTKAKIQLKSINGKEELEFQPAGGGSAAKVRWSDMGPADRATLAMLVAHLKDDSEDAKAMAGVYMENLGKLDQAEEYYTEAGAESRKKFEALFD
jgi:hypothetical protein